MEGAGTQNILRLRRQDWTACERPLVADSGRGHAARVPSNKARLTGPRPPAHAKLKTRTRGSA